MLTKQHQFISQLTDPEMQNNYRMHMCGLCHALGDQYGQSARLLTTFETTLMNLLTSAQTPAAPEVNHRRCPMNPLKMVPANHGTGSTFAAASAIMLSKESAIDHLRDADRNQFSIRALNWLLSKPASNASIELKTLGFNPDLFALLEHQQLEVEGEQDHDPATPTMRLAAELFAMTGLLAGCPQNETSLRIIGKNYGAYIYWMDAFQDYIGDIRNGSFNPFRLYSKLQKQKIILKSQGIRWLAKKMCSIHADILLHFPTLTFYRYKLELEQLLVEPIRQVTLGLAEQAAIGKNITFKKWHTWDILKAMTFLLPQDQIKFSPVQTIPIVFAAKSSSGCNGTGETCNGCSDATQTCGESCNSFGKGAESCGRALTCNPF